jgi:hypothetical protein
MRIFQTRLSIEGSPMTIDMDTIEYEDSPWLVPEWLEDESGEEMRPTRMIWLLPLAPQEFRNFGNVRWVVSGPVPKFLFEGRIPPEKAKLYRVLVEPDVWVPISPGEH